MSEIDLTQFAGHTPGPWTVDFSKQESINIRAGAISIATVHGYGVGVRVIDARLLAAAPDLLATLAARDAETERLKEALHHISLCSQNSMSSKEECGRIARAALNGSHDPAD